MANRCLLCGWGLRAVDEQAASPAPILPRLPAPTRRRSPRRPGSARRSLAPHFSKSQHNGCRWLPARIASLDPEFRSLDLRISDPGAWIREDSGTQMPVPRGWAWMRI